MTKPKQELTVLDYMSADAGAGMENVDKDSFAIPFLQILQKSSDQVDEASGGYIEGAKPGMFWESVSNRVFDGKEGIRFLQCAYQRRFVRWGPRDAQGGFKGELEAAEVARMEADGRLVNVDGRLFVPLEDGSVNEKRCDYVADTRNHYGLLLTDAGAIQVVMPLTSTKIKSSKQLMSMLNQVKVNGKAGPVTPPTWASIVHATTVAESNEKGSWHGIRFNLEGFVEDPTCMRRGKHFMSQSKPGPQNQTTNQQIPLKKSFDEFLSEMSRFVPAHARVMLCQFRGSPEDDSYGKWRARVITSPEMVDPLANVYLCVSAMTMNSRGEFRRRKENFAGGLLLMIDDVGTGPGSKFPLSTLDALPPTALIQTSPDNFQATYFFDRLYDDLDGFDALIRAFIERKFLGKDTGQAGVNRVFRPPAGINGKPKYKGWKDELTEWEPGRRYSPREIQRAFNLNLVRPVLRPRINEINAPERIRHFKEVRKVLRAAGMIKREDPDYSGWIHITCPWTFRHTNSADNGAAIRLPAQENEYYGAFRCHHGSCAGKGWRDLTDWVTADVAEELEAANVAAGDWGDYR